jgi:IS5 family transposase
MIPQRLRNAGKQMQAGFFDLENRHEQPEKPGDPLPKLSGLVDWEGFRPLLERIRQKERKSAAGRTPFDVVLMFKILFLQGFYGLGDDQTEYQIRDRYSFCRFLGLTPEGRVPDARTIWLFREALKEEELIDALFAQLDSQIRAAGYRSRKGQIVDASLIAAPRQRNSKEDNARIKQGGIPEEWKDHPAKLRQKDVDARWTKKNGESHYGYKNHISVDNKYKLIRHFAVTSAEVHDSQLFDFLVDEANTSQAIWADAAYRSRSTEAWLKEAGYRSHIHTKGQAGKPLSACCQQRANKKRSSVRVRVEHVFAAQKPMAGDCVRTIGHARARLKLGLINMAYNMKRWSYLEEAKA